MYLCCGKGLIILITLFVATNITCINGEGGPKFCATLYKDEDFGGSESDNFVLNDGTRVSNFEEEHVTIDTVWNLTRSFQIHPGCVLNACNGSYFDSTCLDLKENFTKLPLEFDNLLSASCSCQNACKCSDVKMQRSSCGRVYLKGGCNACNPLYMDLKGSKDEFGMGNDFSAKFEAMKVREGCTLKLFDEPNFDVLKETIEGESTKESWNGTFKSFDCFCTPGSYAPKPKPPRPSNYPALIDIPSGIDEISTLMKGDLEHHPGLKAAKMSFKSGRSPKNSYILLLGTTGAGKSTAVNLLFDNPNITKVGDYVSTTTDIHEFRIPVPVDELGIKNSELRVIDTPGLGDTRGLDQDSKFLATLDDYLGTHEELHDRMPNVILIFHKYNDTRFSGDSSFFVKMLRGLDSFRTKLTDKSYSNVIFVLSHFCSVTKESARRPKKRLLQFKNVIEEYTQFPKPIVIVPAENKGAEEDLPMVNGYFKLPNGDYYPKNLFDKIELLTSGGSDPIGDAVIRTGFKDSEGFKVSHLPYRLVESKNQKVNKYYNILSNTVFRPDNTEVSQRLAKSFERMDVELAKNSPGVLSYLQKALNIRDIITMEHVPRSTLGILELFSGLKKTEATIFLLKDGLELHPPVYEENVVTGYSYNVFKDEQLPKSPYNLGEMINSDIGYVFPSAMTCAVESQSFDIYSTTPTKAEYVNARLSDLGIEGDIEVEEFKGKTKPGFNIEKEQFFNDSCYMTAVREIRTFELTLNENPKLTKEFIATVQQLPPVNQSDIENVNTWKSFFNEYGTHVVRSVHGGGSITIQLKSDKECDADMSEALFELIQFAEDLNVLSENSTKTFKRNGIEHSLKFRGGDSTYHTADLTKMTLSAASKLLREWKNSLRLKPTILLTEMKLYPISSVVRSIGQNISSEVLAATSLLFNSTLKVVAKIVEAPTDRSCVALASDNKMLVDFLQSVLKDFEESREKSKANLIRRVAEIIRQRELDMIRIITHTPPSRHGPKPVCLRPDTRILLADGEERAVEKLKVGDALLDHNLEVTTVLGVSTEFLRGGRYYGFEEGSYFFTNAHLFVGPKPERNNETQIYTKDVEALLEENPLMEYLDVIDMDNDPTGFPLYTWNGENKTVSSKKVQVFQGEPTEALDALVYFIQVDSPSGTYFANGYVCRHDIPPIHLWPNTMAVLFTVFSSPELPPLQSIPFTLKSVEEIEEEVKIIMYNTLETIVSISSVSEIKGNYLKLVLEDKTMEEVISNISNQPSFHAYAMGIYGGLGKAIAGILDSPQGQLSDEIIGSLQHKLVQRISDEIAFSYKTRFI